MRLVILGIGVDIVETCRIAQALARHGETFARRVFTDVERGECSAHRHRAEAYASRFAAKEACFKAIGRGLGQGLAFVDVEVAALDGVPEIRLSGFAADRARQLGVQRIHVSLTHEARVSAGVVLLEG